MYLHMVKSEVYLEIYTARIYHEVKCIWGIYLFAPCVQSIIVRKLIADDLGDWVSGNTHVHTHTLERYIIFQVHPSFANNVYMRIHSKLVV